jgi:hypothetical protein
MFIALTARKLDEWSRTGLHTHCAEFISTCRDVGWLREVYTQLFILEVSVCVCVCVCMYLGLCIFACLCVYLNMYVCVYVLALHHTVVLMNSDATSYLHATNKRSTRTYSNLHTHTLTHTHTHTRRWKSQTMTTVTKTHTHTTLQLWFQTVCQI